ncbi:hypothetical protein ACIGQE_32895 [Streptomyces sp. NPDC053429]|uniref:hypothetical protein n=1 Tax=Streptomyces sp. NPDC053429 TaxID=3365702 RepID=UPI0037D1402C
MDLMAVLEKSASQADTARSGGADATVHDLPAAKKTTKKTSIRRSAESGAPSRPQENSSHGHNSHVLYLT